MPMIDLEKLANDLGVGPDPVPTEAMAEEPEIWVDNESRAHVLNLPEIVDSATFVSAELPEPKELVSGLMHSGTKVVIGGGSKSFKTWVQIDLALCVAYGLPFMGHATNAGKVLFINFEIKPPFFQRRIKKICEARGIQQVEGRLDIWNLRGYSAPYRLLIPKIIERIKNSGYVLIILDPIYKLYGDCDENSAHEVAQLLNELERVCVETEAAIVFGAHYSKGNQSSKEAIDRVSGSGVFARDPDSIIPFTRHEEDGCFVVEPILRNLPPVEPFVVRWNHPLMERDDDLDPASLKQAGGPGKKKEYDPMWILGHIKDRTQSNPVSVSEWAKLCGIPRQTLQDYIEMLRGQQMIATIGEGNVARKYITKKGLSELGILPAGN